MNTACNLCDGACAGADLAPLLDDRLAWLWDQIGHAADRRGDPSLVQGSLILRAPAAAEERAAAAGLVGGRVLVQGQRRTIDLTQLMRKLRVRGPGLTPGAVAAHALGRPLAMRAAAQAQHRLQVNGLKSMFIELAQSARSGVLTEPESIWTGLQRSGWIARLTNATTPDRSLHAAVAVLRELPPQGAAMDRRQLASRVTGNPHALDHGTLLAGLALAMLVAGGRIEPRQSPRRAWADVGVRCDDVVGGLIVLGILPIGWTAPLGSPVTLPPRVLSACHWPEAPAPNAWVFVTENPSVVSAAADLALADEPIHLICTNGTPSDIEIAAIARVAHHGWRVAVRADFDSAGLAHVAAILQKVPDAIPWRMSARDYRESLKCELIDKVALDEIPDVDWDPELSTCMRETQVAAYEELLLPSLLADLQRAKPDRS